MLNYGRHRCNFLPLKTHSHAPAAAEFTENLHCGTERAKELLQHAQEWQEAYADKGYREGTCEVGDKLLLDTECVRN